MLIILVKMLAGVMAVVAMMLFHEIWIERYLARAAVVVIQLPVFVIFSALPARSMR